MKQKKLKAKMKNCLNFTKDLESNLLGVSVRFEFFWNKSN